MSEVGESVRVRWSPRSDRSWCPGSTLPGQVGCEDRVLTGWTTFFSLQSVLGRRRPRAAEPTSLDAAPSLLPREQPEARPTLAEAPELD